MTKATAFTQALQFDDPYMANLLFGAQNHHLKVLSEQSGATLNTIGTTLHIEAATEKLLATLISVITQLYGLVKKGTLLAPKDFTQAFVTLRDTPKTNLDALFSQSFFFTASKKNIGPKNANQSAYLKALQENDMVFAIGPAGTGKTYLAVAMALTYILTKKVKRIILTRPAVEAGEKLGFLPGDLAEKINPYLRPLYDALHDMLDYQKVAEMMETGIIEVAPLAFMRGRTLNNAFIILDEAQNTTPEQMKMFLTRLGFGSRAVVTGDITQIDLPMPPSNSPNNTRSAISARSGLGNALELLSGVEGIAFHHFTEKDVVRHPLVGRIIKAYEHNK